MKEIVYQAKKKEIMLSFRVLFFFFKKREMRKLELTPWKAEQPPKAWSYTKKMHNKIKAYRKYVQKGPTVKRCLLILDLKPLIS